MPTLTIDDARTYLKSVGIVLPDFMLQLLVNRANGIDACLTAAGYDDDTALLIKLYLLGLFGVVQGDRYVTSQSAPSGASQSYKYGTLNDRYKAGLGLLRTLDTSGCALAVVPPNPAAINAGVWLGQGGCDCP